MTDIYNVIDLTVLLRLTLAGILGGLIGAEREAKGKPGGFRTNILICIGSALFVQIAIYTTASYNLGDPTRVIAQVITGVGFLGAGAIIKAGEGVRGMTSAATIWVMAGIGMAVGVGDYFTAIMATLLILIVLWVMNVLEKKVRKRAKKRHNENK